MSTEAYRAAARRYIASSSEALRPNEYLDFHAPVVRDAFNGEAGSVEDQVLDELSPRVRADFGVRYERSENCYRVTRLAGTSATTQGRSGDNPGIATPTQM